MGRGDWSAQGTPREFEVPVLLPMSPATDGKKRDQVQIRSTRGRVVPMVCHKIFRSVDGRGVWACLAVADTPRPFSRAGRRHGAGTDAGVASLAITAGLTERVWVLLRSLRARNLPLTTVSFPSCLI